MSEVSDLLDEAARLDASPFRWRFERPCTDDCPARGYSPDLWRFIKGTLADKLNAQEVVSRQGHMCTCGGFVQRSPDEVRALEAGYAATERALTERYGTNRGPTAVLSDVDTKTKTIDRRPCDPIEPDHNPVCITEDDLT